MFKDQPFFKNYENPVDAFWGSETQSLPEDSLDKLNSFIQISPSLVPLYLKQTVVDKLALEGETRRETFTNFLLYCDDMFGDWSLRDAIMFGTARQVVVVAEKLMNEVGGHASGYDYFNSLKEA